MFILLILWPLAEVLVAIEVARAIGVLAMFVLLIAGWPLGTWTLRSQGRAAWRRLAEAVSQGRNPSREVLDGALVLIGGMLLMIPGFITDVFALVCLLPPTRALVRGRFARRLHGRLFSRAFRATGVDAYDVDSTAQDIDQPQLHR